MNKYLKYKNKISKYSIMIKKTEKVNTGILIKIKTIKLKILKIPGFKIPGGIFTLGTTCSNSKTIVF